ncbi:MFS transporter, partial [Kribbella sp. NPDC004138]
RAAARRPPPPPLRAPARGGAGAGVGGGPPPPPPAAALIGLTLLGVGLGSLFPMGVSVAVSLVPGQAALASGRAVAATSGAILLAPFTVGTLADAFSLKAALAVTPVMLLLAAVGLVIVSRARTRTADRPAACGDHDHDPSSHDNRSCTPNQPAPEWIS